MKIYRNFPNNHPSCALTIGNYDGMHKGHQVLIDKVKFVAKKAEIDSCVMIFEPHPREFFLSDNIPSRIISLRDKLKYFEYKEIDRVYIVTFNHNFALMSGLEFINKLKSQAGVEHIVVGEDFRYGKNRESGIEDIKKSDINITIVNEVKLSGTRVSSTLVRNALGVSDFLLVKKLLGRPYKISGRVVHGEKKGRALGFPTANINMFHNHPPLKGVFVVKLDNRYGVANLGVRPTVSGIKKLHLEVHVLDLNEDLYGQYVEVTFFNKLRDEKKFNTVDELKVQIQFDINEAKSFIKKL
jgi:riboflavin kinase/FMN adenylyltransferase